MLVSSAGIGCEMGTLPCRLSARKVRARPLWGLTEFGPGLAALFSEVCGPALFLTLKVSFYKGEKEFKKSREHLSFLSAGMLRTAMREDKKLRAALHLLCRDALAGVVSACCSALPRMSSLNGNGNTLSLVCSFETLSAILALSCFLSFYKLLSLSVKGSEEMLSTEHDIHQT